MAVIEATLTENIGDAGVDEGEDMIVGQVRYSSSVMISESHHD